MTTKRIVSSAAILCVVFRAANCSVVTVLSRRSKQDPEVPCALALIPPLFELGENDSAIYSHAPRLYVFGKTRWINEFLRQFPNVASMYLFSRTEITSKFEDFITTGMMPSAAVALVLQDASSLLELFPYRVRVVTWESLMFPLSAKRIKQLQRGIVLGAGICHRFLRHMVTARYTSTTHVFAVRTSCDFLELQPKSSYEPLGFWSPGSGWSPPGVSLFPPPCVSWRPSPDGQPLLVEMLGYEQGDHDGDDPLLADVFEEAESYEVLRLLRDYHGIVFETRFNFTTDTVAYPLRAAERCHLDMKACLDFTDSLNVKSHTELSVFSWESQGFVCVVPAGAGRPYHILYPITAEFTVAVWSAVAVSVIAVATSLYLMRSDEGVQQMVLVALAPLLAQPLGGRQERSYLLGVWLLGSVVVVAAYQGQLLSFITNPPNTREINTWEDWLESDLLMLVNHQFKFLAAEGDDIPGLTQDRIRVGVPDYIAMITMVVTHRNSSFVVGKRNFEIVMRNVPQEQRSKLHTFELETYHLAATCFATSKGSPLEVPLRNLLGRIRAAGGLPHPTNYKTEFQQTAGKGAKAEKVSTEDSAIAVHNLMPVILIYITGNIFAILNFSMEFLSPLIKMFVLMAKINMKRTLLYLVALCIVCSSTIGLVIIFLQFFYN